ncbi:MAG: hypothetical protein PHN85_07975 [Kiritimatiellae bacterium]|nr:hypothetical protein [Kiritimatiellia bacterium]
MSECAMGGRALAREPLNQEGSMSVDKTDLSQRKRLAHLPPVERTDRPVILFVTLTVQPRGDFLASDMFHAAFLVACDDADTWMVGRYVIMPDHVHLFCAPGGFPAIPVRRWTQYLKRRVTIRLEEAVAARGDARPPGHGPAAREDQPTPRLRLASTRPPGGARRSLGGERPREP